MYHVSIYSLLHNIIGRISINSSDRKEPKQKLIDKRHAAIDMLGILAKLNKSGFQLFK